jgi:peptide/nickel transport system permease protein
VRWYALRRLVLLGPVILGILVAVFILMRLVPGDPVRLMAGFDVDEATVRALRHELGLDRPIPVQFGLCLLFTPSGSSTLTCRPG